MIKLSFTDLKILLLGMNQEGKFDEKNLEKSELKELGVGRILDHLGSLMERNLIKMNKNGSFSITDIGRHVLWDNKIPLGIRILRVLEIKSQTEDTISSFLLESKNKVKEEIEHLRKKHLVLMFPLRKEGKLEKFYEILPEGIQMMEKVESEGFQEDLLIKNSQVEVLSILDNIILEIEKLQEISKEKRDQISSNLLKVKEKLEI